jgi:hypothetical protein
MSSGRSGIGLVGVVVLVLAFSMPAASQTDDAAAESDRSRDQAVIDGLLADMKADGQAIDGLFKDATTSQAGCIFPHWETQKQQIEQAEILAVTIDVTESYSEYLQVFSALVDAQSQVATARAEAEKCKDDPPSPTSTSSSSSTTSSTSSSTTTTTEPPPRPPSDPNKFIGDAWDRINSDGAAIRDLRSEAVSENDESRKSCIEAQQALYDEQREVAWSATFALMNAALETPDSTEDSLLEAALKLIRARDQIADIRAEAERCPRAPPTTTTSTPTTVPDTTTTTSTPPPTTRPTTPGPDYSSGGAMNACDQTEVGNSPVTCTSGPWDTSPPTAAVDDGDCGLAASIVAAVPGSRPGPVASGGASGCSSSGDGDSPPVAWLFESDPTLLGFSEIDENGFASFEVTAPAGVAPGEHSVVAASFSGGAVIAVRTLVTVSGPTTAGPTIGGAASPLPETGTSQVAAFIRVALGLIALGGVVVSVSRRREERRLDITQ